MLRSSRRMELLLSSRSQSLLRSSTREVLLTSLSPALRRKGTRVAHAFHVMIDRSDNASRARLPAADYNLPVHTRIFQAVVAE